MQFWAVLQDTFRESLDRKIFWVIVGLSVLVALSMFCVEFQPTQVSVLFGKWTFETVDYAPQTVIGRAMIAEIVVGIMSACLGWIGVLLMIVATASFFPTMLERGAIDVVLAKPISRARLFLYKYAASMVFVLLQATVFVGLTFTVVGLRWQVWLPGYLLAIPLLVLLFSYLYCVSVLVGVVTRSVIAAILLTVGAWVAFIVPPKTLDTLEVFNLAGTRGYQVARVLAWIPPKTGDIEYLASRCARGGETLSPQLADMTFGAASATPEERELIAQAQRVDERKRGINPWTSIGSSLLFEAAVVAVALRRFVRRDF